jgi:hypothetical protein
VKREPAACSRLSHFSLFFQSDPSIHPLRNGKNINLDPPANSTTVLDAESGERQL